MHWLYILFSESGNKYYIGSSSNPEGRLVAHNHPKNKGFTRRYQPWKLVFTQSYPTKSEAESEEYRMTVPGYIASEPDFQGKIKKTIPPPEPLI